MVLIIINKVYISVKLFPSFAVLVPSLHAQRYVLFSNGVIPCQNNPERRKERTKTGRKFRKDGILAGKHKKQSTKSCKDDILVMKVSSGLGA